MSSEPENSSSVETVSSNRRWIIIGAGVIGFFLVIACSVMATIYFLGRDEEGETSADASPTPFPTVQATLAAGPIGEDTLVVGISDSATISVSLDVPVSLVLGDERFPVRQEVIGADGSWNPQIEGDKTATWVYGTIINYVIGLPDSEANQALLSQLTPGEEMIMTTRGGIDYTFTFNSRDVVARTNLDIFAQTKPGLTVVLLGGEGEERIVVTGRYVVPETSESPRSPVAQLGETAQLEDIQITAVGATYVLDRPESPPGFAFYLVDYQLQNVGLTALNVDTLQFSLLDDFGNQYSLNPVASRLGNFPPYAGFLNSNQMVEATAGYQVPIGLNSTAFNWVVTRNDTGGQLLVNIPFGGSSGTAQSILVTLAQAQISNDLTSLVLAGQVTNPGDQPLLVSEEDVTLRIEDGSVYLLLSTNPSFPWTVGAGQTIQYQVTFQRPSAANAIFELLNQPFQLNNLR